MILIGGKAIVSMHWPSSKKIQGTITVVLRNGRLITAGHVVGEVGSPVYAPIADNGDFSDDNLRQVGKVVFNPFIAGDPQARQNDIAVVQVDQNSVHNGDQVFTNALRLQLDHNHPVNIGGDVDIGAYVAFWGYVTNHHTAIVVGQPQDDTHVQVRDGNGVLRWAGGVCRMNITHGGTVEGGDSGAPVFRGSDLVGLAVSGYGRDGQTLQCVYVPIDRAAAYF